MKVNLMSSHDVSVSIIIPIYNVEKYMDQCVESVLNQTFSDIEIILVDDGSTDSCSEKCDKYAVKDDRIHVVHKKNMPGLDMLEIQVWILQAGNTSSS